MTDNQDKGRIQMELKYNCPASEYIYVTNFSVFAAYFSLILYKFTLLVR